MKQLCRVVNYAGMPGKYVDLQSIVKPERMAELHPHNAFSVLVCLALSADENGFVSVSLSAICELCDVARVTAYRAMQLLASKGLIERFEPDFETKSRQVPEAVKWAIFKRDGYACRYCGKDEGPFHLDHVMPLHQSGLTSMENLVTACPACNRQKSGRTPEQAGMVLRGLSRE